MKPQVFCSFWVVYSMLCLSRIILLMVVLGENCTLQSRDELEDKALIFEAAVYLSFLLARDAVRRIILGSPPASSYLFIVSGFRVSDLAEGKGRLHLYQFIRSPRYDMAMQQ